MRRVIGMTWLIAAGLLAGCRPIEHGPPTVRFGEEACAACRMIISDERFAAAVVTADGDVRKFDDIGCLVEHESGRIPPDAACWVRDSRSGEWLDARQAIFIHSPSIASPMGFGLAARPTDAAADESAGWKLRFDELHGFLTEK